MKKVKVKKSENTSEKSKENEKSELKSEKKRKKKIESDESEISEKKWKGGRFKVSEAKFRKLPSTRGHPKFMIHKIAHPPLPPKIRFFPQIAPYHPRFSKRINNQLLKNTLIICRVWRNAISSEMYYISSKWMRHWATKLKFLAKYSNFWVKC